MLNDINRIMDIRGCCKTHLMSFRQVFTAIIGTSGARKTDAANQSYRLQDGKSLS
jgi:hypothetical protein